MNAVFLAVALQTAPPSEGDVVNPKVTVVTEYGCFVDLGLGPDWSGLAHVTDLSWGRVDDPATICKVGKRLRLKVLKVHDGRVALSAKLLVPDPWDAAPKKYPVGQVLKAKAVFLAEYGLWLEVEPGVEALLHISEIPPSQLRSFNKVGKRVKVVVTDVDGPARRMAVVLPGKKPAPVAKTAPAALDDLFDVLPNLSASLSVLEPMAAAGRIDDEELRRTRDMLALVAADVEVLCTAGRARPDAAACTKARADLATVHAALQAPTAPALKDAYALCRALLDQLPRW